MSENQKEWEACKKCKRPKKVGKSCVCEKEGSPKEEEDE